MTVIIQSQPSSQLITNCQLKYIKFILNKRITENIVAFWLEKRKVDQDNKASWASRTICFSSDSKTSIWTRMPSCEEKK